MVEPWQKSLEERQEINRRKTGAVVAEVSFTHLDDVGEAKDIAADVDGRNARPVVE